MLTCYGHTVRLPQNDLAYIAFRLALQETLTDIELQRDLDDEPDLSAGYLSQDLSPDHARHLKEILRLPDEAIEPMYAALERWNVSPNVATNLPGLMTDAEIAEAMPLLAADAQRPPRGT